MRKTHCTKRFKQTAWHQAGPCSQSWWKNGEDRGGWVEATRTCQVCHPSSGPKEIGHLWLLLQTRPELCVWPAKADPCIYTACLLPLSRPLLAPRPFVHQTEIFQNTAGRGSGVTPGLRMPLICGNKGRRDGSTWARRQPLTVYTR